MKHSTGVSPLDRVKAMQPTEFFRTFAQEMKIDPPHAADGPMVHDLASIGLVPGRDFDPSKLTPGQLEALNEGARAAAARIEQFVASAGVSTPGWRSFQGVLGRYGTDYVARAATARIAIGANPPEDAVYMSSSADGSGQALDGSTRFRMHFDAIESASRARVLVRYGLRQGGLLHCQLHQSLCHWRSRQIEVQSRRLSRPLHTELSPGQDRESNWLPSGAGPLNLTIRLYWPKQAILEGSWHPPALARLH